MEMEAPFDGLLTVLIALADPDLQMGGGGHPDPEIRGGGAVSKKIFSAIRASLWSKNKGGTWAPPLDPPLHCFRVTSALGRGWLHTMLTEVSPWGLWHGF